MRLIWNSSLRRKEKVRIFEATFINILLYGLDTLTLTPKQLHRIDGQYDRFLRRAISIKASYYSHISNQEVWTQASKPTLPSRTLSHRQYQLYIQVIQQPREDPTHNIFFGPAFKDRILLKGRRRGMQFPYWVEVYSNRFFPHISRTTPPILMVDILRSQSWREAFLLSWRLSARLLSAHGHSKKKP